MQLYNGDCLELMKNIPDKSVDMILCDLPYGVLNKGNPSAKWDSIIPFEPLWEQYERVIKDNGAIVLFASGMFTAKLMASNEKLWRYNLIWQKDRPTGILNANRMPLRSHEDICVFYKSLPTYNPQKTYEPTRLNHPIGNGEHKDRNQCYGKFNRKYNPTISEYKMPTSIVYCPSEHTCDGKNHPTQKPVDLCRWLIRTYTNEGDLVLDNTMGSGTTGVACKFENRDFIGIELEEEYFKLANSRINNVVYDEDTQSNDLGISLFDED